MFGIGSGELFLIIIVAVLVLGPEHLPRIMRTTQSIMSNFRKITTEFQRTLNLEDVLKETDSKSTAKRTPPTTKKKKRSPVAPPKTSQKNSQGKNHKGASGTPPDNSGSQNTIPASDAAAPPQDVSGHADSTDTTQKPLPAAIADVDTNLAGETARTAPQTSASQESAATPARDNTPSAETSQVSPSTGLPVTTGQETEIKPSIDSNDLEVQQNERGTVDRQAAPGIHEPAERTQHTAEQALFAEALPKPEQIILRQPEKLNQGQEMPERGSSDNGEVRQPYVMPRPTEYVTVAPSYGPTKQEQPSPVSAQDDSAQPSSGTSSSPQGEPKTVREGEK